MATEEEKARGYASYGICHNCKAMGLWLYDLDKKQWMCMACFHIQPCSGKGTPCGGN